MGRWTSKGARGRGQAESGAKRALSPGSQLGWETAWSVLCQVVKQGGGSAQDGPRLDQEVFSRNLGVVAEEGVCPGVFIYLFIYLFILAFITLFFLSLYWICYIIVSVLCFVFLDMRHVGSWLPWPGIEPAHPELEGQVLTYWTTREVPNFIILNHSCIITETSDSKFYIPYSI